MPPRPLGSGILPPKVDTYSVCPYASYLTSLSLSFLRGKMGTLTIESSFQDGGEGLGSFTRSTGASLGKSLVNDDIVMRAAFISGVFVLSPQGTELNDDRTPSDATVTTTFNILVIDINDNAPEFNSSEYSVAITELAQVGFALPLFIQVVDKDEVSGRSMWPVQAPTLPGPSNPGKDASYL